MHCPIPSGVRDGENRLTWAMQLMRKPSTPATAEMRHEGRRVCLTSLPVPQAQEKRAKGEVMACAHASRCRGRAPRDGGDRRAGGRRVGGHGVGTCRSSRAYAAISAGRWSRTHVLLISSRPQSRFSTARNDSSYHNAEYRRLWSLDAAWLDQGPTDSEILDHCVRHEPA